jgi:hypothetical protein
MKNWAIREVIASAIFGGLGAAWVYVAAFGEHNVTVHYVLWYLALAFSSFSLALAPQRMFSPVARDGLQVRTAPVYGLSAIFSNIGGAAFLLAAASWITSTLLF